jgi:hypothetical protein
MAPINERAEAAQAQKEHMPMTDEALHILSQEGQPYGSSRRCCNHCGVMIWGSSAPRHVDNWTDWRAAPDNCGKLLPTKEAA